MARQIQLRRGTAAQHASFTGVVGELTADTDDKRLVYHDGSTAGGVPAAKESELQGLGAWDDGELADNDANLMRIVWVAAGNIKDEKHEDERNSH